MKFRARMIRARETTSAENTCLHSKILSILLDQNIRRDFRGTEKRVLRLVDAHRLVDAVQPPRMLRRELPAPFQLDKRSRDIDIGASVGIAIYPTDALDADALVKVADATMYQAKQNRK